MHRLQPRERSAKPCSGLQVGAQTETELKEKKLRVEDALNATKAAVEEGIVIGGGCTLLRLVPYIDQIKVRNPARVLPVRRCISCLTIRTSCAFYRSTSSRG